MTFSLENNQNLTKLYEQDYCLWMRNTVELFKLDIPNLIEKLFTLKYYIKTLFISRCS